MPEQRSVDQALPQDAVPPVPTPMERVARVFFDNDRSALGAIIIVVALLAAAVLAMFSDKLATQGFQLLNTLASGAVGYFFASSSRES